jgi:hypothetical protein
MQTRLMSHFRFSCDFVLPRDLAPYPLTHAQCPDTGAGLPTELNLNPYWCKGEELREVIFDGDFIQVLQYKRSTDPCAGTTTVFCRSTGDVKVIRR